MTTRAAPTVAEPRPVSPHPLVQFRVAGLPRTQGSHRPGMTRHADPAQRRPILREQNTEAHKLWRGLVEMAARAAALRYGIGEPLEGPLRVVYLFALHRGRTPKYPWPIGKNTGDFEKLARAVSDACTLAGLWRDDCLITDARIVKAYPGPRVAQTSPGVVVRVWRDDADDPATTQLGIDLTIGETL